MATKPLVIPNVFASEGTGSPNNIPLLDADFSTLASYFNDGSFCNTRGADTGTVNNYAVTLPSGYVPSAYNQAMRLVFNPLNSSTGPATINVNGLGSQTIVTGSGAALTGGEIVKGQDCDLIYDGTNFRILGMPLPQVWAVRLRSFNSVGNPNWEVDQRNAGAGVSIGAGAVNVWCGDRWQIAKTGSMAFSSQRYSNAGPQLVPGTNFQISSCGLSISVLTQQATLAATDYLLIQQTIEGPYWRELSQDAHSVSLLVLCNIPLAFAVSLRDPSSARSLVMPCSITTANQLTLIQLPNLPIWPGGGTFSSSPGSAGYVLTICLAGGSNYVAPATGTWQNGNFIATAAQDNFASKPVGTVFNACLVQHEPGAICTQPMDKIFFSQNLLECQRYFRKSWDYATAIGTAGGSNYAVAMPSPVVNTSPAAYCSIPFAPDLAKAPTLVPYSNGNGAANYAYQNGVNFAATIGAGGSRTINQVTNSGGNFSSALWVTFHWTADTNW